jgi:CRISPR/Cas system-associated exonuclease Cas4 (RecB family)
MIGPPKSYISLIDEQLAAAYAAEVAGPVPYPLRPSAAGECARKLAYELAAHVGLSPRETEDRKPSVSRLLRLGTPIEDHVISYLKSIPGFTVRFQQQLVEFFTLESGRIIEGSTDVVMWSDTDRCLADVKSVGDRFDASYASKWERTLRDLASMKSAVQFDTDAFYVDDVEAFLKETTDDTLKKNVWQINGYACTPFMQKRGINHASILRYCKNNSRMMEVRFRPSLALFRKTQERFQAIETAVLRDSDPTKVPKEAVLGSMACAYCPYQKRCWPTATKRDHFAGLPARRWAARTSELEKAAEVEALFSAYESAAASAAEQKKLEQELLLLLDAHSVNKVKLANGNVYETKQLKDELVLRKSKE